MTAPVNGRWQGQVEQRLRDMEKNIDRMLTTEDKCRDAVHVRINAVLRDVNALKLRLAWLCAAFSTVGAILGGFIPDAFRHLFGGG